MIHGCGAANLGVVCAEMDADHYMCKCPGVQTPVTVKSGDTFEGCPGLPPPTPEEILAQVNITNLEASLVNGVMEVVGVIVVDINGDSFTLNITATVPIDTIQQLLKEQIAKFLGGNYEANDITLELVTKKKRAEAETGTVIVRLGDRSFVADSSDAGHVIFSWYGVLALFLLAFL